MSQDYSSVAKAEDDVGSKRSIIAEQMQLVSLEPKEEAAYKRAFLPRSPVTYTPIADELANVSARLSGYFCFLRFCLASAYRLGNYNKEQQTSLLNSEAERILKIVSNVGTLKSVAKDYLLNLASGANHVLQPSVRFKNGYDVHYLGNLTTLRDVDTAFPTLVVRFKENTVQTFSNNLDHDNAYKTNKLEQYSTELSLGAIATGEAILTQLFGGGDVLSMTSATKRLHKPLLFTFDFEALNSIFYDKTGIMLNVDFMKNISPAATKAFGDYFSVTPIRTPNADLLTRVSGGEKGTIPDASKFLTTEGMALAQTISFSFTMSLPEKIVRYVTQSPATEKVSLLSLHNWVTLWSRRHVKAKGARVLGGRIRLVDLPAFVLPISKSKQVTELRKTNGYALENGKGDENNIYVGANGGLHYGLPADKRDMIKENLNGYESTMDDFLTFCFDHGLPLQSTSNLSDSTVLSLGEGNDLNNTYKQKQTTMSGYSGKILSYDWDYNVIITANVEDPSNMVAESTIGAAKVDTITLADYLGFDFAEPGQAPIVKTFADSLVLMLNLPVGSDDTPSTIIGKNKFIAKGGPVGRLLDFYNTLVGAGLVKQINELIATAAEELDIKTLEAAPFEQNNLYNRIMSNDLKVDAANKDMASTLLRLTVDHCNGGRSFESMVAKENEGVSFSDIRDMIPEHEHYFDATRSTMTDFGRLYNYLGGKVFQLICAEILAAPSDKLFSGIAGDHTSYQTLSKSILPMAAMFSKYVPNGKAILEQAESDVDANKPDTSLTEADVHVSGSIAGAQFFPHQVVTHQSLRKKPKFAVLDIAPGGGKTTLGVTDIAALITDLNELGDKVRPIVLCPDGLIKNWVDDMKIHTGSNWNMIPITTGIIDRWGYDKLQEMLNNAPVNTIVVAGFNCLTSRADDVVFGSKKVRMSNNLEFIKRFGFDYICIDESHKLARKISQRHRAVKQLTTWSGIRYLRLATGTLIHGRVTDIIGQASLYNGHIFREGDVLTAKEDEVTVNGDSVPLWKVDTPARARAKLSRYASVVTLKKKNWAFMLPSPIEFFHAIPLVPRDNDPNVTEDDVKFGELHRQLYDTVLHESLESLQALAKRAKKISEEDEDDDEGEEEDEGDGTINEDDTGDFDLNDGELNGLSSNDLKPYIARLERLITNPMADPLAPTIFGLAGVKHYSSTVAKFVGRRINQHFNVQKWSRDKLNNEYDLVEHNGLNYLAKKYDRSSLKKVALPENQRGIEPQNAPDYWREEPVGKVIVFCRYTNSVNGIYDALPDNVKKMAVKFTGEEEDKWSNLDAFKSDPSVQVIIANEMGIAEGHNLQMASRIIRVESPWNPGDLDQSASRIFRPDPAASKEMVKTGKVGTLYREVIFLDWVLCDGTLHVQKQSRLISKIFNKARFDEATNPLYKDVLDHYDLPEIPMSLEILQDRSTLADYDYYVQAYASLNAVMHKEFSEMRGNMDPKMRDLPIIPEVAGSRKIATPFISNQKPDDPDGLGLISLRQMLRHADIAKDPASLIGGPVVTDLGKGRIAKLGYRYRYRAKLDAENNPVLDEKGQVVKELDLDANGNKQLHEKNPISSVVIKLVDDTVVSIDDPGILFVPTKLTATTAKQFVVKNLAVTEAEQRKLDKQSEKDSKAAQDEEDRAMVLEERRRRKERKEAEQRGASAEQGRQRKKNIEAGKPINAGVKQVAKVPNIKMTAPKDEEALTISIHPAYYHGFLTLEVRADDPDAPSLQRFGFKPTGPYAYVRATKYAQMSKILDYIDANFEYGDPAAKRLEAIQDAFETDKNAVYKMELAPASTLPYFFATRKKKVEKRKEIRPYPIVLPTETQIAVDIATCPIIKSHIGKSIPGASTKWTQSDGHELFFAKDKNEMRAKLKELTTAGYIIENKDEALAEIANIKFKAARSAK